VFTAYFFARMAQKAERQRVEAESQRLEAERRRVEAETKLQILKDRLERANAPRRRNRRRSLR
jgi:hypothetical protein